MNTDTDTDIDIQIDTFLLAGLVAIIVLLLCDNRNVILTNFEKLSERMFNWSIQQLKIKDIISTIKKGLFVSQIGFIIIDLIGFLGLVWAINNGSYHFAIIILWIGIFEKCFSLFVEKEQKQIFSALITSLRLVIGIYFNNSLCILLNIGKLISLLLLDSLLVKVKYIFLKVGLNVLIDNKEINEDSLQSVIITLLNDAEIRFSQLNNDTFRLNQTIKFICNQVIEKIDEVSKNINNFANEINYTSKHIYIFKVIITIYIIFALLDLSMIMPKIVFYSLIIKIVEIFFGDVTIVNSMMNNSFNTLEIKFSKIKRICITTKLTTSAISFTYTKINQE